METRQGNFKESVMILRVYEQHIVNTSVIVQGMSRNINALVEDAEKNRLWIGAMMRENNEQTQVL